MEKVYNNMIDRRKKILIIDAFIGMGGEEEVAFYLYKNLNRSKYDVKVMSPYHSRYFDKNRPNNNEFISHSVTGKFALKEMLEVRKIVRENMIDLIHVHGYSAGYFIRLSCAGLKNVRIVWTMHLDINDVQSLSKPKRYLNSRIENTLSNSRLFTDRIICVSQESKQHLIQRGIKKVPIKVIYNGVDIEHFLPGTNPKGNTDELVLGFISRLSVQKNIPLLLEVAKTLIYDKKYNIKLLIAGEGEMYDYAEQYIKKYNLQKAVKLLGFQKDVNLILNSIDVLILPSLYECFPMIILEAFACSVPVIASKVNGIPEVIENGVNGYLAVSKEKDEFIKAVENYYFNHKLIRTHGKNGRDLVEKKFTKEIMLKLHENLYEELF